MVLEICTDCNGTGWEGTIPCVNCNVRGVVCDQLFSQEIIDFDKERKKTLAYCKKHPLVPVDENGIKVKTSFD